MCVPWNLRLFFLTEICFLFLFWPTNVCIYVSLSVGLSSGFASVEFILSLFKSRFCQIITNGLLFHTKLRVIDQRGLKGWCANRLIKKYFPLIVSLRWIACKKLCCQMFMKMFSVKYTTCKFIIFKRNIRFYRLILEINIISVMCLGTHKKSLNLNHTF